MILYHGSNVAFKSIDLAKGMPSKDFGRGFYATDSLDCAEKTARQRVARLGGLPKVMVYDCDESQLALLQSRIGRPCFGLFWAGRHGPDCCPGGWGLAFRGRMTSGLD